MSLHLQLHVRASRWAVALLTACSWLGTAVRITRLPIDPTFEAVDLSAPEGGGVDGEILEAGPCAGGGCANGSLVGPSAASISGPPKVHEAVGPSAAAPDRRLAVKVPLWSQAGRGARNASAAPDHRGVVEVPLWSQAGRDARNASSRRGYGRLVAPRAGERRAPSHWREVLLAQVGRTLMAIGGGTGVALGEGVVPGLQREYDARAWYQNNGLATLIVVAYYVVLFMCVSHLRWHAQVRSSVTYYACDGVGAMEGHDAVGFLSSFNQVPRQVLLQVVGYLPSDAPDATGADAPAVGADQCRIAFNFALDVSPWIVREEWSVVNCSAEGSDGATSAQPLLAGIEARELEQLQAFLESDANDLASAVLHKNVAWPDWEDVATNIRQRIRQCGFPGTLDISLESLESVKVQKNKSWAKFMTHRYMPVLCMLSIVGWPLYAMYMSWRCTELSVDSHFRVDIEAEDYWSLISDQLSASGFDATASSTGGSTS